MAAARKTYTRHCDYCDTDYQTTSKPYRGKAPVFTSCSKTACMTACTDAYNAAREARELEVTAIRAARTKTPRQQSVVATDWNLLVAFSRGQRV